MINMNNKHNEYSQTVPLEGQYANYFKIGSNAYEFVIDFGQVYSQDEDAHIHTRIVTNPAYARALLDTLQDSINKYDQS
jgi:hypothetical protein